MAMCIPIYEVLNKEVKYLGDYEFEACPKLNEVVQVSGPMGDLDFMKIVRVEHHPVELPRTFITEDKKHQISLYVEFESRYSG